jgi:hypothetical protein
MKLEVSWQIFEKPQILIFMKICPVGDMTKLMVAFCNFATLVVLTGNVFTFPVSTNVNNRKGCVDMDKSTISVRDTEFFSASFQPQRNKSKKSFKISI